MNPLFVNESRYSVQVIRDFQLFQMKKLFYAILAMDALLMVMGIALTLVDKVIGLTVLVLGIALCAAAGIFIWRMISGKQYAKLVNVGENSRLRFDFLEEGFRITAFVNGEETGYSAYQYPVIHRMVQYRGYLFIYLNKRQAVVMEQNGMRQGEFVALKVFLREHSPAPYLEKK